MAEARCQLSRKKSLFEKYDVPIDHCDFNYIKKCNKLKELEHIVKILRSPEEGHFPELLLAAEERLGELDPQHRLLRVQGKPLTKDMFEPAHWQEVVDDINNWSKESSKKEKALRATKSKIQPDDEDGDVIPPVRKATKKDNSSFLDEDGNKVERIKSFEYDKWDKFDADAECLKMDVQMEKLSTPVPKKPINMQEEVKMVEKEAVNAAKYLSKIEKENISSNEKELGNECYKANELKQAVIHYTKSLAVNPNVVSFNNRAAAYLKLGCNQEAIDDATTVVQLEPTNLKGLYRRAQGYQMLEMYSEAIKDTEQILRIDENHSAAKQLLKKLKSLLQKETTKDKRAVSKHNEAKVSKPLIDYSVPGPSGINSKLLLKNTAPTKQLGAANAPVMIEEIQSSPSTSKSEVLKENKDSKGKRKGKTIEILEVETLAPEGASEKPAEVKSRCEDSETVQSKDTPVTSDNMKPSPSTEKVESKPEPSGWDSPIDCSSSMLQSIQGLKFDGSAVLDVPVLSQWLENCSSQNVGNMDNDSVPSSFESDSDDYERSASSIGSDSVDALNWVSEKIKNSQGPTVKVASKYIKKVSKPTAVVEPQHVDLRDNVCMTEDETIIDMGAQGDGASQTDRSQLNTATFCQSWSTLCRENAGIKDKAEFLRKVPPEELHSVISSKLDDGMLSDFAACLDEGFDLATESHLVLSYLQAIANLERFFIIYTFIPPATKKLFQRILVSVDAAKQLKKLYK